MHIIAKDNHRIVLRFDPDEEVISSVRDFCGSEKIHGAWISGLGSSRETVLSFYNSETRAYEDRTIVERLEIVNLTGNFAYQEGKAVVHSHGTFGDNTFVVRAGHVKKMIVSATCEVELLNISPGMEREYDEKTGLNILKPVSRAPLVVDK